ncbi:MAG: hypothetical protein ACK5O2_11450 [Microthrixaceae bacterium]
MKRPTAAQGVLSTGAIVASLTGVQFVGASPAAASHADPFHWDRFVPTATAIAQMYAVDHTSSDWPVNASTIEWNKSSAIGFYYRNPGTCNTSTLNCIPVYNGDYGATNWYGRTTFSVGSGNHIVRNSMTVLLNDHYKLTTDQHRSVTCHELGHATGVFNDSLSSSTSCMTSDSNFPRFPNQHDYDVLAWIYAH